MCTHRGWDGDTTWAGVQTRLTYEEGAEHVDGHDAVLVHERAEHHVAHDGAHAPAHHRYGHRRGPAPSAA